jgi:hypothetical protein
MLTSQKDAVVSFNRWRSIRASWPSNNLCDTTRTDHRTDNLKTDNSFNTNICYAMRCYHHVVHAREKTYYGRSQTSKSEEMRSLWPKAPHFLFPQPVPSFALITTPLYAPTDLPHPSSSPSPFIVRSRILPHPPLSPKLPAQCCGKIKTLYTSIPSLLTMVFHLSNPSHFCLLSFS